MVEVTGCLGKLCPFKVLVVGDFFLDTYTIGKAKRISPEAPVAIINAKETNHLPGGAGNVVLNLLALGGTVFALGRIGNDGPGQILKAKLQEAGANVEGLLLEERYSTGVKNRIIADTQQIVRVDYETVVPPSAIIEQQAIDLLSQWIPQVDVIAISDYGKGLLTKTLLQEIIRLGKISDIPMIADPKGIDFSKYRGVTVLKPNYGEAVAASGLSPDVPFETIALHLLEQVDAKYLMITKSEVGISVFQRDGMRYDAPVRVVREIKDVTGAGDTVLAMLTCVLASGLPIASAAHLCNLAAGIAIERFGCASVTLAEVAERALEYDIHDKIFDEEHLFALQHILANRRFVILGFEPGQGFTPEVFREIRNLSQQKQEILVYLPEGDFTEDFIDLIASLIEVRYILLHGENLRRFCEMISPQAIYMIKENKAQLVERAEALLI